MIRFSTETDLARDHAVPRGRPDRRLVAFRPDSPPGSPGGCPKRLLRVNEAAHSRPVSSCCFPCFENRLGRQIKSTDLKPEVLVNSPLLILLRRLEEFTGMWSAPSIPVVQGPSNSRYFTW